MFKTFKFRNMLLSNVRVRLDICRTITMGESYKNLRNHESQNFYFLCVAMFNNPLYKSCYLCSWGPYRTHPRAGVISSPKSKASYPDQVSVYRIIGPLVTFRPQNCRTDFQHFVVTGAQPTSPVTAAFGV